MAKATYYNGNLEPKEFEVITDHKDGTVDIGTVGTGPDDKPVKTVVVGKARVCDEPTAGCVTLVTKEQEKAAAKAESEEEKEKAKLEKADAKQAVADDAANKADAEKAARAARTSSR